MTTSSSATLGPDVGVVRLDGDVLDRQYAEMIAESIPHIVWTASPDGTTTYFNRQGTDYTGCPRETNYEWNWVTLVHAEDVERAAQAWQYATMTGTDYLLEYRIRRFDGIFRWHSFRSIPLRNALGGIDLWPDVGHEFGGGAADALLDRPAVNFGQCLIDSNNPQIAIDQFESDRGRRLDTLQEGNRVRGLPLRAAQSELLLLLVFAVGGGADP